MDTQTIEKILKEQLELDEVYVTGENAHYHVIAVSDKFANLSPVKQQQMIYAPLMEYISTNAIHAVTMKVFTPEKWQRERMFHLPT